MGFVSGFTSEIVSPLETAAGQLRQLSGKHQDANNRMQSMSQALITSFGGKGADAFLTRVQKQGSFIQGITGELNSTAGAFEKAASLIKDAAQVADDVLGGPLLALGEHVLSKLSPPIVVHQGESAVSAVVGDMRQTFHSLLHHSGGIFGDIVHFHFSAAFHDAEHALGDLAHLAGDIFALLDQVETVLGRWAGQVMQWANWLINEIQSILFKVEDFAFGFSDLANNSAILADPNSTPAEKALAATGMTITLVGDVLLFIPGAEEGKVAAKGADMAVEEGMKVAEQEAEKELEKELEDVMTKDLNQELEKVLNQDLEKELEKILGQDVNQKVEQEIEKEGLTGLEKLGIGTDLTRSLLEGSSAPAILSLLKLSPVTRDLLEKGMNKVSGWAIKQALIQKFGQQEFEKKFGEKGVEDILNNRWTKLAQDDVLGKAMDAAQKEFIDRWTKGPFERFKEGLITEPELEKESEELAKQIMQGQPVPVG